jgi:hypothetical protein
MDILKYIPENGVCNRLFIVGPYPMDTYIKEICKRLKVQNVDFEIIVYADESWNEDIVEKIKQIENTKVILVKGENGDGLVHAKMYFLDCKNSDNKSSCTLITGSANASKSGMTKNAEVLTVTKLAQFEPESQKAIKQYFSSFLKDGNEEVEGVVAKFKNSKGPSSILLPALKKSNKTISFYSWLRSGYLFYKYEKDQNFGYIVINLEKPLPGDKKITGLIKKSIFKNDAELHSLRYPYLKLEKIKEKRLHPSNYALQSDYGYWISKDCFNEKKNSIFQEKISSDLFKSVEIEQKNTKKIIEKVKKSIEKLIKSNQKIKQCIGTKKDEIESIVIKKINRDYKMSKDENFIFRYKTGYAQHKMPHFDEKDFKEFLDSIMGTCLIKLNGNSVRNLFVKKLRDLLDTKSKKFDEPEDLSNWLDRKWPSLYEQLRYYYKNDIRIVSQQYKTDSGIACVAMLFDKGYDSVMKKAKDIFSRNWGGNDDYGMNNKQMKKLIQNFKCDFDSIRRFRDFNTWDDIESRSLVSVCYDDENKSFHWIIADRVDDDLIIYDPRNESPVKNPENGYYENIHQYLPLSF